MAGLPFYQNIRQIEMGEKKVYGTTKYSSWMWKTTYDIEYEMYNPFRTAFSSISFTLLRVVRISFYSLRNVCFFQNFKSLIIQPFTVDRILFKYLHCDLMCVFIGTTCKKAYKYSVRFSTMAQSKWCHSNMWSMLKFYCGGIYSQPHLFRGSRIKSS